MGSEPAENWPAWMAAGLLVLAGSFVLWRAEIFELALSFPPRKPVEYSGDLWTLGASALVAGGFIIFRKTRNLGWMLAGCVLTGCALASFLLRHISPAGFDRRDEHFSIAWIGWAVSGLYLVVGLLAWGTAKVLGAARVRDGEQRQRQGEEKKAAETQLADAREYLKTLTRETAEAKAAVEIARDEHRKTIALRPYESHLVAAFTISLGIAWRENCPGAAFSLNQFQGNRDRDFGDLVGQTQGSCWLMELKRDWSCVDTEFRKPARERQFAELQNRPDLIEIAAKCHWLGWGEADTKEATLRFTDYWTLWKTAVSPVESISNHAFAQRAFAGNHADPVGETPAKFAAYMRFLSVHAAGADDADTIVALVFHRDATGRVRYWMEPNLVSVGEVMGEKYRAVKMQIENRRAAERRKSERGYGHGPSF